MVGSLSGGIWLVVCPVEYMVGSLSGGIWLVVCPVVYGW